MLLVMGYTGKKALQIKLAYINAFNQMEAELAGQFHQALAEPPPNSQPNRQPPPSPHPVPHPPSKTGKRYESLLLRGPRLPGFLLTTSGCVSESIFS
jgi:phage regulator Rha-like protein